MPETLVPALDELTAAYQAIKNDAKFWQEFESLCHYYAGRPTPLYFAERLTAQCGGAKILLKREDLAHTGAHKINNAAGTGIAGKKARQAKNYRRNRRRTARCCHRGSLRPHGIGMRDLHGLRTISNVRN